MPALMPKDTQGVLGENAEKCESRSLFMDRFARPDAKKEDRKRWFELLARKAPAVVVRTMLGSGTGQLSLFAQLQSRLMVNMAGGVMENAGLCLDRFGLPYVPGSAVKGCARQMAIQNLLDANTVEIKADLLVQIALVFGWGEQDWSNSKKDGRFKSDFAYAVGDEAWPGVSSTAMKRLPNTNHFAGLVSFLPAHPVDASDAELPLRPPALGALDLDVVTCHHPDYYQGKGKKAAATDDEEPNPVIFPAVAAGHIFAFGVLPMRLCTDVLLKQAHHWLADGLSTFGLGAKTAAGYGWFDCSERIQTAVAQVVARRKKIEAEQRQKEAEAAATKAREEADRKRKEEQKAVMASLTPEQQEDYKLVQLSDDQLRSAMDNFAKRTGEEQKAIVRAFRLDVGVPGSRRLFWEELKAKAQKKGGRFAQTEQAVRQLSKQMFPGKEGKMP
jgi:CRISPR type III-B/RAMP module RAMP protein Cmr6